MAAAVVACCGVSGLIAGGVLGVVGGFIARWWPALIAGIVTLLAAWYRYFSRRGSSGN